MQPNRELAAEPGWEPGTRASEPPLPSLLLTATLLFLLSSKVCGGPGLEQPLQTPNTHRVPGVLELPLWPGGEHRAIVGTAGGSIREGAQKVQRGGPGEKDWQSAS